MVTKTITVTWLLVAAVAMYRCATAARHWTARRMTA